MATAAMCAEEEGPRGGGGLEVYISRNKRQQIL